MLDATDVYARLPHAGDMCLLGRVLHWDADTVRCDAVSHRSPDNPLRIGDSLPALCGLEYAAQALALHGVLAAESTGAAPLNAERIFVVVVRNVACRVERLDVYGDSLDIDGEVVFRQDAAAVYKFAVRAGQDILLDGQIGLMSPG